MSKLRDHVGIDFGNYSVKAVEIKGVSTGSPTLVAFGKQNTNTVGIVGADDKENQKKVANALKLLYKNNGFRNKDVVIAMPESVVFTRFISLVGLKESEIETAVYYKAKQYLPMPVSEVNMSYIILGHEEKDDVYNVLVVAAPKSFVNIYTDIVLKAGLEPLAIETEAVAIGRSMIKSMGANNVVILNFGSQTTDIGVMSSGQMIFSQSIAIGSDSLTQALVNQFGLEYNQAEQYKRGYGVTHGVVENKIYNTLKPILDEIWTEVQRGVEFYKTSTVRSAPRDYLLNGDAALLPGLPEYIQKNFGVNAHVGDPWRNISIPSKLSEAVAKERPSYSVAVGLALKEF